MEKLSRRSDGVYETPTGLLAISPRAVSGTLLRNGQSVSWFEFKAGFQSAIQRVEWSTGAPAIAVPADVARILMARNYAANIDDAIMEHWNNFVDQQEANGGGLRTDGPTVEEWVAKGYQATGYPPEGYESKSTPEQIAAAIAAQAPPAEQQTPAAPVAPSADASTAPPAPPAPAAPAAEGSSAEKAPATANAEKAPATKGK